MNSLALFDTQESACAQVTFPTPRPFQDTAHQKLRDGFRGGHKKQLLVAPTGSGKTLIGLRIIHEALQKRRRAIFVCDRTALIDQTSTRADEYGLEHAIVQANHWRRNNTLPFQIASIQTIQARGYWPPADVIVIDEAHTQYDAGREMLEKTNAAVIGLTATPCTKGLGKYYTNMVNAATMHELTESGVLVPMKILSCTVPDMSEAKKRPDGEWTAKSAGEAEAKIVGDVVAEWVTHGEGEKTIAFGADIAYCNTLVQRFNEAGISAATFTTDTSKGEREELLKEFSKSDSSIRILVSVEALAKGFDVQDIGCVIDARPLRKSLSTAIQMWGRGLRSAPGKSRCILLDFTRNIVRFMADFEEIYFNGFSSLDASEKMDAKARDDEADYAPSGCPGCGHKPFKRRCLSCGFEKETQALEDTTQGVMQEVVIGSGKNRKVLASDRHDLYRQLCGYARARTAEPKQEARVFFLYRDIIGEPPPREWVFGLTESAPVTKATRDKIKSRDIAFRKGRKKQQSTGALA